MRYSLITMHSVTGAMKGQKALTENGIYSEIVRLPPKYSDAGCSYGLSVPTDRDGLAAHILNRYDVPYGKLIRNP